MVRGLEVHRNQRKLTVGRKTVSRKRTDKRDDVTRGLGLRSQVKSEKLESSQQEGSPYRIDWRTLFC